MNVSIAKGKSVVIMLFPILFIIMPRPPLNSTDFLVYPIIGLFCLYFTIVISKNYRFNMRVLFISFVIMLYSISISISAFFSNITLGFGALIHIFKPLLFILCLIFGYFIGVSCKSDKIFRYLLKAAYIIILVQIVIGLAQLFGLHLFDIIYSPSKARSLGQIVRITGTLDNPNLFAWFVIQMTLIIYLFENNKIKKILFIIIGVLLVFLSGSRTLFCLFPVILLMTQILLSNKNAKYYFTKIPKYIFLFISFVCVAYWFINRYGDYFPYIKQLLTIVKTGSLSSVNSFYARTLMWDDAIAQINNQSGFTTLLFGLGPGAIKVLDNDYLYSVANYGFLGLVTNIIIYIVLFYQFKKESSLNFSLLGKLYIVFSFILGLQFETLNGWNFPILIMFYAGIAIALRKNHTSTSTRLYQN